jgi:hypothetical protein
MIWMAQRDATAASRPCPGSVGHNLSANLVHDNAKPHAVREAPLLQGSNPFHSLSGLCFGNNNCA